MTTHTNLRRPVYLAATITAGITFLSACGDSAVSPEQFHELREVAQACPADENPVYTQLRIDESGSARSANLAGTPRTVVEEYLTYTAACGGRFSLVAFSAGAADTAPILEETITRVGATRNSHLRNAVPELVETSMEAIDAAYPQVAEELDVSTDVVAQFRGGQEFLAQARAASPEAEANIVLVTDGLNTQGSGRVPAEATVEEALELADNIDVPDLSGANLRIVGIGQVASGENPSTAHIEALTAFYQLMGERTGADEVLVVTEHQGLR
ncbi:hypothetical protein [Nesterenkonia muleiensis]|uniref:hypothetical protein n=1 Tax=Nesterenkonia muleiensis TaxID=2282648 RepID=UPI000E76DE21|nr:hypothetical protein [Nesterenkonia muleiensis]